MLTLRTWTWLTLIVVTGAITTSLDAQGGRRARRAPEPGTVSGVTWSDDGAYVSFNNQGQRYRLNLETNEREAVGEAESASPRPNPRRRRASASGNTGKYVGRPTRGRQYTQVDSPNGRWEAHYKDWNVVLRDKETDEYSPVTIGGNAEIHYGTASWVYGEELNQTRAMWWTPDSRKLLFYRFDDRGVEPFHLVTGWSKINTAPYPEFYPKAGAKNPAAELMIYDLGTQKVTRVDLGGSPDEYVFDVRAALDEKTMLVNWTNRLQQHLKVCAIDLETGKCRIVVEERQETWQTNQPRARTLEDKHRFIWTTERNGYTNYDLRDLDGNLQHALTSGQYQCGGIEFVDETQGLLGYTAFSSPKNPYYSQYHVVGLDGKNGRRVTTREFHHSNFQLSPNKKWLVAQYEKVNTPPSTALYRIDGSFVANLAEGDPAKAANLAEMFSFRSDDGKFDIYGILYKPRDFDSNRTYPIINALYGGPGSREFGAGYVSTPRAENNRGYLVVKVNNRGTGNRGKAFLGAAYLRLGDVDIQDHADAVRLLRQRPYVDGSRVGIVGHSYGGYMAAMGILKHPDVYTAAVNRAGVTDWRNYDTIYTERYMSTPQLNTQGYDTGRAMNPEYIAEFKKHDRKMLIMHGMVDDNVHPNNAFQLIDAFDRAGVSYESRFFPSGGHGLGRGSTQTQWEFFDRILEPKKQRAREAVL